MQASADRLEFAPPATPGRLRALLLAALMHGLLLAALTWGVRWQRDAQTLSVEAELWSAVPQEAAPKLVEPPPPPPPPQPEVPPEPAPPPPQVEPVAPPPAVDIALEQEKRRQEQLKKQEQARQEKLRQKLEKDKLEKALQEKQKQEKLKQDKLKQQQADKARQAALDKQQAAQDAKQLEVQRLKNLQRITGLAGAAGADNAKGTAKKSSGPSASYAGRISARIKPNIVFTEDITGNPTAEVEVRTAPDGTIVGRKIVKSSGTASWDEAVLKAIDKTEVLPRDVDGSMLPTLLLVFRPKD